VWWGRSDPAYSRNGVIRQALTDLGWSIVDFYPPKFAPLRWWSARRLPQRPDAVWVPCFRQRDLSAASRWAWSRGLPLIFDPLISAYDKQVNEKQKFKAGSPAAERLCIWESHLFAKADVVIADTQAHARYFQQVLAVPAERSRVIPVSASSEMFRPTPLSVTNHRPIQVLFYGSFIALQGPELIVEAARLCPDAQWTLLGAGPLRESCEHAAAGLSNVSFEAWIDFSKLPERIAKADLLLGVFSSSEKAGRVVPNKVYQAMASGRAIVTRQPLEGAYAWNALQTNPETTGIVFVQPGDPAAIAQAVRGFVDRPERLRLLGEAAGGTFAAYYSTQKIKDRVQELMASLG